MIHTFEHTPRKMMKENTPNFIKFLLWGTIQRFGVPYSPLAVCCHAWYCIILKVSSGKGSACILQGSQFVWWCFLMFVHVFLKPLVFSCCYSWWTNSCTIFGWLIKHSSGNIHHRLISLNRLGPLMPLGSTSHPRFQLPLSGWHETLFPATWGIPTTKNLHLPRGFSHHSSSSFPAMPL